MLALMESKYLRKGKLNYTCSMIAFTYHLFILEGTSSTTSYARKRMLLVSHMIAAHHSNKGMPISVRTPTEAQFRTDADLHWRLLMP